VKIEIDIKIVGLWKLKSLKTCGTQMDDKFFPRVLTMLHSLYWIQTQTLIKIKETCVISFKCSWELKIHFSNKGKKLHSGAIEIPKVILSQFKKSYFKWKIKVIKEKKRVSS